MSSAQRPAWQRPMHGFVEGVCQIGTYGLTFVIMTGQLAHLCLQACHLMIVDPQRRAVTVAQMYRIGNLSLPVVVLTGISMSLVLALQGYETLRAFNAETVTGGMVNFTVVSQIMPVLAGLTLAGRVGSSIAAEIGTMKVTEQIDALRVMGTDPVSYLVVPRLLACVLLMPVLTAIGSMIGILAAAGLIIGLMGVDPAAYWYHSEEFIGWWDIATGLGKTLVYGAIIALVACRKGLGTRGGATGVGEACTEAVVEASMLILFTTFLLTVVLQKAKTLIYGLW